MPPYATVLETYKSYTTYAYITYPYRATYDVRSVDLLESLGWKHLELRRNYLKSVFMYKILNNHTAPNLRTSFRLNNECDNTYMILEIEKLICLFLNRIPILVKDASNITER